MSYEQISESTYFQNVEHWNRFAREVREFGGLGICDDETGEELTQFKEKKMTNELTHKTIF